jgi:hypothetical protein
MTVRGSEYGQIITHRLTTKRRFLCDEISNIRYWQWIGPSFFHSRFEGHKLMVFENKKLRRMCGPKVQRVTAEYEKLHSH